MKTSFVAWLCLAFSMLNPLRAACQTNQPVFDSLLSTHFPKEAPGAVVYMSRGDTVIYQQAFGKASLELDVAMESDQVFRLGSITKQFTACAILKLSEEGKLSLKDDIHRFIPDFSQKDKKIRIEHLLTHTSGIKNYTGLSLFTEAMKRRDLSPKELVDLFKDESLEFEPGSAYRYSNSGYVLLGYIIEQVTGKSYGEYIEEVFFKLLGMKNSCYDQPTRLMAHRASGYSQKDGHSKVGKSWIIRKKRKKILFKSGSNPQSIGR